MSSDPPFAALLPFSDEEKVLANKEILERVARVVFATFMDDEPMSEEQVDELLDDSFGIASLLMGVCGMNVVGENSTGDYVVDFRPYASVEDFMREREQK